MVIGRHLLDLTNGWEGVTPAGDHVVVMRLPGRCYLAILIDMSLAEHLPLADVKNRLSEVIEKLEREHGRVVVTKHGRPAAVLVSIEDLESLEETLE
ncbi:MAG: type II toxin-antitoxin system Phd/YefM family antitoxin, partial [Acidimicrobiales bacterium]